MARGSYTQNSMSVATLVSMVITLVRLSSKKITLVSIAWMQVFAIFAYLKFPLSMHGVLAKLTIMTIYMARLACMEVTLTKLVSIEVSLAIFAIIKVNLVSLASMEVFFRLLSGLLT